MDNLKLSQVPNKTNNKDQMELWALTRWTRSSNNFWTQVNNRTLLNFQASLPSTKPMDRILTRIKAKITSPTLMEILPDNWIKEHQVLMVLRLKDSNQVTLFLEELEFTHSFWFKNLTNWAQNSRFKTKMVNKINLSSQLLVRQEQINHLFQEYQINPKEYQSQETNRFHKILIKLLQV